MTGNNPAGQLFRGMHSGNSTPHGNDILDLHPPARANKPGYDSIKRLIDIAVAAGALILFAPVIAVTAIVVRATMGAPVLFHQVRPGRLGKPFKVVKFRTLRDLHGTDGHALPDHERLHPIGTFLRRTSLDELPQLWNILTGDMSLVGPRPLLMQYLPNYTPEQARRHLVKPGLTGWAQIHGRQHIPFSKRLELDVWYVDHRSFLLDMKILFVTFLKVLTASGVKPGQHVAEVDDLGLNDEARR